MFLSISSFNQFTFPQKVIPIISFVLFAPYTRKKTFKITALTPYLGIPLNFFHHVISSEVGNTLWALVGWLW